MTQPDSILTGALRAAQQAQETPVRLRRAR
jgi:hypothetical protein